MSPTVSYWMPAATSNVLNPSAHSRQVIGVVKGRFHQVLDQETYLSLLAERLDQLIEAESEGPEGDAGPKQFLSDSLERLGLEDAETLDGRGFVASLSLYLQRLNIPGPLPERMPPNVAAAQRLYEETTLESWTSNLLNRPVNPER